MNTYFVVDWSDKCVLYAGPLDACEAVQDTQYGGLFVLGWEDLDGELQEDAKSRFAEKVAGL